MADTKISGATAVVTPASTDEYPTNQGGVSKKTTRAQMHSLESGEQLTIDAGSAAAPSITFDGENTGFYSSAANRMALSINGAMVWQCRAGEMLMAQHIYGPTIMNRDGRPSILTPTIVPCQNDTNTGLSAYNDILAAICGGINAGQFEDPADLAATETSLWLYDADNATLEQVTVGAADSGGSGYKVLRIPN